MKWIALHANLATVQQRTILERWNIKTERKHRQSKQRKNINDKCKLTRHGVKECSSYIAGIEKWLYLPQNTKIKSSLFLWPVVWSLICKPLVVPVQTRSFPVQVPFCVHLLTLEPDALDPSLQEKLHTVSYNMSVVLHPSSSPLVGADNVGHVTAVGGK